MSTTAEPAAATELTADAIRQMVDRATGIDPVTGAGWVYNAELGLVSGVDPDGEIYTIANLAMTSTDDGRCYGAARNGPLIAAAPAALRGLLRLVSQLQAADVESADLARAARNELADVLDDVDAEHSSYLLDCAKRAAAIIRAEHSRRQDAGWRDGVGKARTEPSAHVVPLSVVAAVERAHREYPALYVDSWTKHTTAEQRAEDVEEYLGSVIANLYERLDAARTELQGLGRVVRRESLSPSGHGLLPGDGPFPMTDHDGLVPPDAPRVDYHVSRVDENSFELSTTAPACTNTMPREAGAGHWRDWHRGHGCDKDPERGLAGTQGVPELPFRHADAKHRWEENATQAAATSGAVVTPVVETPDGLMARGPAVFVGVRANTGESVRSVSPQGALGLRGASGELLTGWGGETRVFLNPPVELDRGLELEVGLTLRSRLSTKLVRELLSEGSSAAAYYVVDAAAAAAIAITPVLSDGEPDVDEARRLLVGALISASAGRDVKPENAPARAPAELRRFCPSCFADDKTGSWGHVVVGDYCTNCGGPGETPADGVEKSRLSMRYQPHNRCPHISHERSDMGKCPYTTCRDGVIVPDSDVEVGRPPPTDLEVALAEVARLRAKLESPLIGFVRQRDELLEVVAAATVAAGTEHRDDEALPDLVARLVLELDSARAANRVVAEGVDVVVRSARAWARDQGSAMMRLDLRNACSELEERLHSGRPATQPIDESVFEQRDALAREALEVRTILEKHWALSPAAPLVEHALRIMERLRHDHEDKCGVVVENLRQARAERDKLRVDLKSACADVERLVVEDSEATTLYRNERDGFRRKAFDLEEQVHALERGATAYRHEVERLAGEERRATAHSEHQAQLAREERAARDVLEAEVARLTERIRSTPVPFTDDRRLELEAEVTRHRDERDGFHRKALELDQQLADLRVQERTARDIGGAEVERLRTALEGLRTYALGWHPNDSFQMSKANLLVTIDETLDAKERVTNLELTRAFCVLHDGRPVALDDACAWTSLEAADAAIGELPVPKDKVVVECSVFTPRGPA